MARTPPSTALTPAEMRVLVVDDYPYFVTQSARLLTLLGINYRNVHVAENGLQAMHHIKSAHDHERYHLLVTGNRMPIRTGYQVVQFLAEHDRNAKMVLMSDSRQIAAGVSASDVEREYCQLRFLDKKAISDLPQVVRKLFPNVPFIGSR